MSQQADSSGYGTRKAVADALLQGFARAWGREVSAEERATIRDGTLCLSFMALELVEMGLYYQPTLEQADRSFRDIREEVARHRAELIRLVQKRLGRRLAPEAYPDLLSWEAALRGKDTED